MILTELFECRESLNYIDCLFNFCGLIVGLIRADQNTGGALLEFPVRTAMHGKSCVSSAIKYDSF